jgi:hypothetical protein
VLGSVFGLISITCVVNHKKKQLKKFNDKTVADFAKSPPVLEQVRELMKIAHYQPTRAALNGKLPTDIFMPALPGLLYCKTLHELGLQARQLYESSVEVQNGLDYETRHEQLLRSGCILDVMEMVATKETIQATAGMNMTDYRTMLKRALDQLNHR